MENVTYKVHEKENVYFIIKCIFAVAGYILLFKLISGLADIEVAIQTIIPVVVVSFYAGLIILFLIFRLGLLVGYLKGNAIKITPKHFPDIHEIVINQCRALQIKNIPDVYILQNGGLLNAYATRFVGKNFVVIYSDVLEEAYEGNMEAVEFIIGHELGHIKRKHLIKSLILFPSLFIPLLNAAYSRGCEYTCDNIGAALQPNGTLPGLLLLASGKKLWRKVSTERFTDQVYTEDGFWSWLAEKVSSHPKLSKRLLRFRSLAAPSPEAIAVPEFKVKETVSDHTSFMPK